ncbi:MAG TPA: PH domain-containing protein [Myxococcota bacterium]|nr:PH domain-containing protein [Myxococcota bacterium]
MRATSALGSLVLLGESALLLGLGGRVPPPVAAVFRLAGVALLALFAAVALVAIRGYRIENGELLVRRPFWSTRYSLRGLSSAARDPRALRPTLFGFGNNGFFAVNGWRRVDPYGWCRALATNAENAVVLRTPRHTLIVTPDRPDEFAAEAQAWLLPG